MTTMTPADIIKEMEFIDIFLSCQMLQSTDFSIIWRNLDEPDRNRLRNAARKYADERSPSCELWTNIYRKNLQARITELNHPSTNIASTNLAKVALFKARASRLHLKARTLSDSDLINSNLRLRRRRKA